MPRIIINLKLPSAIDINSEMINNFSILSEKFALERVYVLFPSFLMNFLIMKCNGASFFILFLNLKRFQIYLKNGHLTSYS
jgi:hypothetical protein